MSRNGWIALAIGILIMFFALSIRLSSQERVTVHTWVADHWGTHVDRDNTSYGPHLELRIHDLSGVCVYTIATKGSNLSPVAMSVVSKKDLPSGSGCQ